MVSAHDGIVEHPLRDALILLLIGLAGPAAVLHEQAGRLLDASGAGPAPVAMRDSTAAD
ncbi:hypothetical protein IPZ58_27815 [Streptomyces roseoverticillatus]|uniref:hypothetical protein n=1 Tax=Streptomyces roseoverticillatus TaxID=66429 RepID=UPI001F16FAE2|nr:hypothetical protein [Streptomyces roseoverticillatus]MCF3105369.1 hypothetical protein [Streptomyces roseoverticillatus]